MGRIIKKYQYGNPLIAANEQRNYQVQSFINNGLKQIGTQARQAEAKSAQFRKADTRANKRTKAPMKSNNLARLQDQLWEIGAFKGVKDRHGRESTYNTAVDGIKGDMTDIAIANAQKMGYVIDNNGLLQQKPQQSTQKTPRRNGLAEMYGMTHTAATGGMNTAPKLEGRSENFERLVGNVVKNPISATVDAALWTADRAGVPSNATNYLRDLNVSIPYIMASASHAAVKTAFNGKSFKENYKNQLQNPNMLQTFGMINPLINRNANFSNEEMQVIKNMAGKKSYITNADIKRESEDGRYGAFEGSIGSYFTPTKVVQTAIGRASGHNGILTDYFDVNTESEEAQRDNKKYQDKANDGKSGWNYGTLRATMPYINSIDIMPDKYKVKTVLNLRR